MIKILKRLLYPEVVEKTETLDEKAVRFGNAFAAFAKDKFDFDEVTFNIDDLKNITSDSHIYQAFVSDNILDKMNSDFLIKQHFFKYGNHLTDNRRFLTFKLTRKYGELFEKRMMYALTSETMNTLYFLKDRNNDILGHYTVENFICEIGEIHSAAYYIYDIGNNKLSYYVSIPLSHEGNQLSIVTTDTICFPPYRSYLVTIKINIEEQRFSKKSIVSLWFGDKILKSNDCEISNHEDFTKQLSKILFPFNLTDKQLNKLHMPRPDLSEITTCFNTEFDNYNLVNNMTDI